MKAGFIILNSDIVGVSKGGSVYEAPLSVLIAAI